MGALVKYPGQGGQGHEVLQAKAAAWLLHQQQRCTEGHSVCHLEREALTPELAVTLQSEKSLGGSRLPHILPSPRVPVGVAP